MKSRKLAEAQKELTNPDKFTNHIFSLRIQNMEYFNVRAPFFLRKIPFNLTDDVFSEAILDVNELIGNVKKKSEASRDQPIKLASTIQKILWDITIFFCIIEILWVILGMLINNFFYLSSPYTPELNWSYFEKNYLSFWNLILPAQLWEIIFYVFALLLIFILISSSCFTCCLKNFFLEQLVFNTKLSRFGKWRNERIERRKWEKKISKSVAKILKSYNKAQFMPFNHLRFEFQLNQSFYQMCEKPRKDKIKRNPIQWCRDYLCNISEYIKCCSCLRYYCCCCFCCFYREKDYKVRFLKYSPTLEVYAMDNWEELKEEEEKETEITPGEGEDTNLDKKQ